MAFPSATDNLGLSAENGTDVKMNAIILATEKSSRMFQTGGNIHTALLPIRAIPNIEQTIMMLHCYGIKGIIIAAAYKDLHFGYLDQRYSI